MKDVGVCPVCSIVQWDRPHDHKTFGTLTPDEATAYWLEKGGAKHASQSGQ